MKDRPWSTKYNALAEDLTRGEVEGWGREQERRDEKRMKEIKEEVEEEG